jgi:hypothetical protein
VQRILAYDSEPGSFECATHQHVSNPPGDRQTHAKRRRTGQSPRFAERHVVALDPLVTSRFPDDALGHAVEIDLLVERHGRCVVDHDPIHAVEKLRTPSWIHALLCRVVHAVARRDSETRPGPAGLSRSVLHYSNDIHRDELETRWQRLGTRMS